MRANSTLDLVSVSPEIFNSTSVSEGPFGWSVCSPEDAQKVQTEANNDTYAYATLHDSYANEVTFFHWVSIYRVTVLWRTGTATDLVALSINLMVIDPVLLALSIYSVAPTMEQAVKLKCPKSLVCPFYPRSNELSNLGSLRRHSKKQHLDRVHL